MIPGIEDIMRESVFKDEQKLQTLTVRDLLDDARYTLLCRTIPQSGLISLEDQIIADDAVLVVGYDTDLDTPLLDYGNTAGSTRQKSNVCFYTKPLGKVISDIGKGTVPVRLSDGSTMQVPKEDTPTSYVTLPLDCKQVVLFSSIEAISQIPEEFLRMLYLPDEAQLPLFAGADLTLPSGEISAPTAFYVRKGHTQNTYLASKEFLAMNVMSQENYLDGERKNLSSLAIARLEDFIKRYTPLI